MNINHEAPENVELTENIITTPKKQNRLRASYYVLGVVVGGLTVGILAHLASFDAEETPED